MSGSAYTAWTDALTERIKLYANEANVPVKYSADRLLEVAEMVCPEIMSALMAIAQNKPTVLWRLQCTAGIQEYLLPPYFGNLVTIGTYDYSAGQFTSIFDGRGSWLSAGPGYQLVGQSMIRFATTLSTGTIDIEFVPTGELSLHKAEAQASALLFKNSDTGAAAAIPSDQSSYDAVDKVLWESQITLATTPTGGTFDRRLNAFIGCILRVYNGPIASGQPIFPIREFLITGYDATTAKALVRPAWPMEYSTSGTYAYEIVPVFGKEFLHLCILRSVAFILGMESPDRVKTVMAEYKRMERSMLLRWSNADLLLGRFWEKQNNPYRSSTYDLLYG